MAKKRTLQDQDLPSLVAPPIVGGAIRGQLTLDEGSVVTDNEHGLDVLIRPYVGFTDEIYKLLPKRGSPDRWLPSLQCTDRSVVEGRGTLAKASITFKGILDDAIPDVSVKGEWAEMTTTLSVTTSMGAASKGLYLINPANNTPPPVVFDQSAEVQITYRAPKTVFLYVQRKPPTGPKFIGQILSSVCDFSIVEMRPARIFGRPVAWIETRCTTFSVEPAGAYWQVTEVQQTMLLSVDAKDLNTTGTQTLGKPFSISRIRGR